MKYDYVPDDMWKKLAIDFAKRWLSHDGLWFQAAERNFGMDNAIKLDIEAWERQTVLEAKRIMNLLGIETGGGLDALDKCLRYRMYAFLNEQDIIREDENTLIFKMTTCRVQRARQDKNMDFFPCKSVGIVEYGKFAETIDNRITTTCISCPPDEIPKEWHCAWKFEIK